MPYSGVPANLTEKMDRCVQSVMGKQKLPKGRAIAICRTQLMGKKKGGDDKEAKDYCLYEQTGIVEDAWNALNSGGWVMSVFDDYVVARANAKYYRIEYAFNDDGEVEFGSEAVPVEHSWVPTADASKAMAVPAAYNVTRPVPGVEMSTATPSSPIRAVEGKDGRYRAYAVLFGDPDTRDVYGQYFDKSTKYYLDWYKSRPWLYHHGRHPSMGPVKVGDWDTIGVDEVGVFVEGERIAHHKYTEALDVLLEEGLLYPSSGALSYLVKVDTDGHITDWPISEVSSTVAPAEFRMRPISQRAVAAIDDIMEGDESMKVKDFLKTFGVKDAEVEAESVDAEVVEGEKAPEGETAPVVETETDVSLDTVEFAKTLGVDKIVQAIQAVDAAVKTLSARQDASEALLAKLSASETAKVKSYVDGDWLGQLFSAIKSAEPVKNAEDVKTSGEVVASGGGDDIMSRIFGA